MGMGFLPYWMMYECLMATFLFYLAHWQTYVTGNIFLKLPQPKKILNIFCPSPRFYVLEISLVKIIADTI